MKILGFNIHITRRTPPTTRQRSFEPEAWLRGDDLGGGIPLTNAYQQVVWVYRAVNALAEQVANIPFLFSAGERGRENLITSGPLLDFYSHPHPRINRFQYWELRIMWLMLRGECFRLPVFEDSSSLAAPKHLSEGGASHGRRRKLKSIQYLDPASMRHIIEDHELVGWQYTGGGGNQS